MNDTGQRLQRISRFIDDHRPLWTQRPFVGLPVPWESSWPGLSHALRQLSDAALEKAEADPIQFLIDTGVAPVLCTQLTQLASVPALHTGAVNMSRRPRGVDERKWQQIAYFNAAIASHLPTFTTEWVDWCAGKGHLGMTLNEHVAQPFTCIEINRELVAAGNRQMTADNRNVVFVAADVLTDDLTRYVRFETGMVALHACGHLNSRMIALAMAARAGFLAVVPCCYQRIDGMHFSPLSIAGRHSGLEFTRHELRLPALDEVRTTAQQRLFRKREMAFRLGVDGLLREASGMNSYTPLGKLPPSLVRGRFEAFARFAADKVQRSLPLRVQWAEAERTGWAQQHLVSALSVSRQLFRRVIEVWLFLDRVAWLEENGYEVQYGTFCPWNITPRNLMLIATTTP